MNVPEKPTIKMACAKGTTDVNGDGSILLKVPGTVGLLGTRVIAGGVGWFDAPLNDDRVKIYVTDEDNILGYGAGATIGSYTDDDVPSTNSGWFFPISDPILRLSKIGGPNGRLVGGLYIKIVLKKGTPVVDTFRCNLEWGVE